MKLFQKVKEIRSREGELHFQRFAIIETNIFSLYIHKIFKADSDLHCHSHPWNFLSLTLRGSYIEERLRALWDGKVISEFKTKRPLTFSSMKKFGNKTYHVSPCFHKIKVILKGPVYSIFLAYGKKERWSYYVNDPNGTPIWDFEYYREFKNKTGFNDNGTPKVDWEDGQYYGAD
jgi:hypothetical protein